MSKIKYYLKLIGLCGFVSGVVLLLEHLYSYGEFEKEILGHETYGIILVIGSIIIFTYNRFLSGENWVFDTSDKKVKK